MRAAKIFLLLITVALLTGCGHPELAPVLGVDDVQIKRDVPYYTGPDADPVRNLLDIYLPREGSNWPTILIAHGGAFVVNDKSVVGNMGVAFANEGFAVACINYRLYPDGHHPDQVTDLSRAVAWALREMPRYGARVEDFTLIGYSAGATLSALAALDGRYLEAQGVSPEALSRVAVISGVYRIADLPLPFRLAFTYRASVHREASPVEHVHADAPPFLILFAEYDVDIDNYFRMKPQAKLLYEKLKQAGVPVSLYEIPGCNHDQIEEQVGRDPDSETFRRLLNFIRQN